MSKATGYNFTEAPPEYSPDATISFLTPQRHNPITFTVVRPLLPFTKSAVLQVHSPELGPDDVVLKIFDSRLTFDRNAWKRPWSLALEKAAAALKLKPEVYKKIIWTEQPDGEAGHLSRSQARIPRGPPWKHCIGHSSAIELVVRGADNIANRREGRTESTEVGMD